MFCNIKTNSANFQNYFLPEEIFYRIIRIILVTMMMMMIIGTRQRFHLLWWPPTQNSNLCSHTALQHFNTLQHCIATFYNTLHCNTLQHTSTLHCNTTTHCIATHFNTAQEHTALQHSSTHFTLQCNTLFTAQHCDNNCIAKHNTLQIAHCTTTYFQASHCNTPDSAQYTLCATNKTVLQFS